MPGNTGGVAVELAESLLVVPVPDVHVAVTPTRREGVVLTVIQKQSHNGEAILSQSCFLACSCPGYCSVPILFGIFLFHSCSYPVFFEYFLLLLLPWTYSFQVLHNCVLFLSFLFLSC